MTFLFMVINIYFSLYTYIFSFLFVFIFLYMVDVNNIIQTSVNFSNINSSFFKRLNFFLFMGSFVGIPPLFGFFNKLFVLFNLLTLQNNLLLVIYVLINLFLLVFYLQQLRYLQSNLKKKFYYKGFYKAN